VLKRLSLIRVAVSAFTLLLAQSPSAGLGQPSATTSTAALPGGLAAVMVNDPQSASLDVSPLSNPSISGTALQIHWSDLEPAEGKPDWTRLDALFSAAERSKKWVQLLIFPGFFSPAWALKGVRFGEFALQYGPGQGTVMKLPVPYNAVYLKRWFAFLSLLSARYGKSPAFRVIAADGPTSVSAECTLPNAAPAVKKWQKLGYTPTKYLGAWQQVFAAYAAAFPNQYVSLSDGSGQVGLNDQGKLASPQAATTRHAILAAAISALGRRFVLQSSNVHAGAGPHSPNSQADDKVVIDSAGKIVTGLQMRSAAKNSSKVMGAAGNPPLALQRSIDLALETNAAGHHINYLEIYEADVLDAKMQTVLKSAAARF
jgi:hypothetical protein